MKLLFEMDAYESTITPIKLADALVECGTFDAKELGELGAYLSTYSAYNSFTDHSESKKPL